MKKFIFLIWFFTSTASVAQEPYPESPMIDYSQMRILVHRELPIRAIEIQSFLSFKVSQPPKLICTKDTPNCWIVSFAVRGIDTADNSVVDLEDIISAPLYSKSEADRYVATLKNWAMYKNHLLAFDNVRVSYPEKATLLLVEPKPLLNLPAYLRERKLIYRFILPIKIEVGTLDAQEKLKPKLNMNHKCTDGCGFDESSIRPYAFFVKSPVYDIRLIANPRDDK